MRLKRSRKVRRRQCAVNQGQALKTLRRLWIDSAEALLLFCQDKQRDAHSRLQACSALADLKGRAAVPFLLRLAADPDRGTVDAALFGLRCLGTRRATRLLIRELRDPTTDARRQAALDALRFLGDRRAERSVAHVLLTDESAQTRELAAEVLGSVHRGRRSARALMRSLSDPSPEVRWWSLNTLILLPVSESDLKIIDGLRFDHAAVRTAESPEQATVAWSARNTLDSIRQQKYGKSLPPVSED